MNTTLKACTHTNNFEKASQVVTTLIITVAAEQDGCQECKEINYNSKITKTFLKS